MNKADLETIPTGDITALIRAYVTIFVWSQWVPSMKTEAKKAQAMIQQLFKQLPEEVRMLRTVTHPATGNWCNYPVIVKSCEAATYYCTGELMAAIAIGNADTIMIDPWEPQDPKVIAEYNKILQEQKLIYQQKQTGEIEAIRAEQHLQEERKKYRSVYGRQDHLLVKYQIYRGENKQLQRIPDRFKMGNKPFWMVMEEIENTIANLDPEKYQTEEQKKIIQTRLGTIEDMMQNLYYTIMRLFSHSQHYSEHNGQYNQTDYCTEHVSMQVAMYSLKDADVVQECIRRQSFMHAQPGTNWSTSRITKEYATFDAVDLSRFHAIDNLVESRYRRQSICSMIMFYETAKQRFDNEKVYLLRDFCVALGILKSEKEV